MPSDDPSPGSAPKRSVLARVDDAVVPRLQRGLRTTGHGLAWPKRALHRLDRRFLGGRPARAAHEHRGLVALVIVVVAFGAGLANFQRYPELREQERAEQAGTDTGQSTSAGDAAQAVGPVSGAEVEPYLQARRQALAQAPEDGGRVAVVSFTDFRTAEEVAGDLEGLQVHEAGYRLPEREPRPEYLPVDDDLVAAVDTMITERVEELEQEEADVASTLETTDDEDFREDFEARLDELRAQRNTLSSDPAILFSVVVEGPTERLRALAAREPVRLVDLAPEDTDPATTTFHGVLPTATDRFDHGRTVAG